MASNLDAIGLRRVDPSVESPDVNVLVTFAATRYTEYTSYPFYDLWPGWAGFGGYDGTWGVYYPWVTGTTYATRHRRRLAAHRHARPANAPTR